MTDATLDDIESNLDRVTDLPAEEAIPILEVARADLQALDDDPSIDEERRRVLEDQLAQRIREVEQRDAYDGALGSSMNPEDEDAP